MNMFIAGSYCVVYYCPALDLFMEVTLNEYDEEERSLLSREEARDLIYGHVDDAHNQCVIRQL